MSGIQKMFGLEYMDTHWRRRFNLDIVSLFVALVLLVGETKEEVCRVVVACMYTQWLLGIDDGTRNGCWDR